MGQCGRPSGQQDLPHLPLQLLHSEAHHGHRACLLRRLWPSRLLLCPMRPHGEREDGEVLEWDPNPLRNLGVPVCLPFLCGSSGRSAWIPETHFPGQMRLTGHRHHFLRNQIPKMSEPFVHSVLVWFCPKSSYVLRRHNIMWLGSIPLKSNKSCKLAFHFFTFMLTLSDSSLNLTSKRSVDRHKKCVLRKSITFSRCVKTRFELCSEMFQAPFDWETM